MRFVFKLTILSLLTDIIVRNFPGSLTLGNFSFSFYLQGVLLAFLWWWFWINLGSFFKGSLPKKCLSGGVALFWSFFVISDFVHFKYLGQHITAQSLRLTWQDPSYMVGYWNSYGGLIPILCLFFLTNLIAYRLYLGMQFKRSSLGGVIIPIFTLVFEAGHLTRKSAEGNLTIEASILLSHINAVRINLGTGPKLHAGTRLEVSASSEKNLNAPHAVVLFVTESLSIFHSKWGDKGPDSLPKLRNLLDQNVTYLAQEGFSNSSATDMSMPSLFTGLLPDRSHDDFHRVPFIWDMFHGSGYTTAWFSSQRFSWAGFSSFFKTKGLDVVETAETMGGPLINDTGQDDLLTTSKIKSWLSELPRDQNIFLIVNLNAAHVPCQKSSTFLPSLSDASGNQLRVEDNCDAAMKILDESFSSIISAVESRTPDFLMFFTSDHGDLLQNNRKIPRLESYYDEIIKVPLAVTASHSFVEKYSLQMSTLKKNFLSRQISNVDLAPTFADLLELGRFSGNQKWLHEHSGESLFSEVSMDRLILAMNTGAIRSWNHEGFGLIQNNYRFIFTQGKGPELYDVKTDPSQLKNIWDEESALGRNLLNYITKNSELKRIVDGRSQGLR
jgi:glucan phosphoethanolaminetransferase (alkaline phosphatase superfamily)